jgi:hypothetical protein
VDDGHHPEQNAPPRKGKKEKPSHV